MAQNLPNSDQKSINRRENEEASGMWVQFMCLGYSLLQEDGSSDTS
jgi:hypothetical protein